MTPTLIPNNKNDNQWAIYKMTVYGMLHSTDIQLRFVKNNPSQMQIHSRGIQLRFTRDNHHEPKSETEGTISQHLVIPSWYYTCYQERLQRGRSQQYLLRPMSGDNTPEHIQETLMRYVYSISVSLRLSTYQLGCMHNLILSLSSHLKIVQLSRKMDIHHDITCRLAKFGDRKSVV